MQLHISKDTANFNQDVADWLVHYVHEVLEKKDYFTIALSGGGTPKSLHELLATDAYKNKIDWEKVHVFFGDERYVPMTDDRSNTKMAFDTLLNQVPVKKENIHIMQTDIPAEQSAKEYEKILHQYFDVKNNSEPLTTHDSPLTTFDLVFLGMGDDGHTLSLFPGGDLMFEKEKWVAAPWVPAQDMYRITLTAVVVNKAAAVAFLATGEKKSATLQEVLDGDYNPKKFPSQIIKPINGQLHWFVDGAAAADLTIE
jgi:6-phosphogluconolactonase